MINLDRAGPIYYRRRKHYGGMGTDQLNPEKL
jgi:hypothetical protein